MEIRYGALRAGWGELRRRRLERRLAELVVAQPRRRDDHHLRRASPGVPADRACPRWQGARRGSMDRRHRNPPRIAARLRGPRLSRSPPARAPDRRARNLAGGANAPRRAGPRSRPGGRYAYGTRQQRWPQAVMSTDMRAPFYTECQVVMPRGGGGTASTVWMSSGWQPCGGHGVMNTLTINEPGRAALGAIRPAQPSRQSRSPMR